MLPIGDVFKPPTQPVRMPSRARAYDTLYSPPPTQTSSAGANSMRPCAGGERRIMLSPSETKSNLQLSAGLICNAIAYLILLKIDDEHPRKSTKGRKVTKTRENSSATFCTFFRFVWLLTCGL